MEDDRGKKRRGLKATWTWEVVLYIFFSRLVQKNIAAGQCPHVYNFLLWVAMVILDLQLVGMDGWVDRCME